MNSLCFGKTQTIPEAVVDGNFISIYNPKNDRFHYFCHRLDNMEIENAKNPAEGKMWVIYINNDKYNWDLIVENNQRVSLRKGIIIQWKLEYDPEAEKIIQS